MFPGGRHIPPTNVSSLFNNVTYFARPATAPLDCRILSKTTSGVELLKQFKEEYMKFEKERQELANAEKLFGIPITSYPVLMSMEQELKGLEQIFSIYERQKVIPFWL